MSDRFRPIDRETPFLFPPSVQKWLPENHLARFVVEVVRELDLRALEDAYTRRGSPAYPPAMLLALLFYGYATGVYSSRKLEEATYDSVAFRYIAANTHPDHDTIAHFRKRFLEQLKPLFVEILLLAHQMGFLKLGTVSLDGTKVKANASKHRALSWAHVLQLEEQLRAEVEELLRRAEAADGAEKTALDIPAELARREERLQALKQAKAKLVERAAERYAAEQAEYEAKLAKREATQQATGKKPRGRKPKPPEAGPRAKDQINLTDEESRIMPVGGGGFEQAYNAQAVVETDSLLVVEARVTQEVNDQGQMEPALKALGELPQDLGRPQAMLADNGYFSGDNVEHCVDEEITPYIAVDREKHHVTIQERAAEPEPPSEPADAVKQMKHRLKTTQGRALYGQRKAPVEPVFGIIKSVMGFRQFLLRGRKAVEGEWTLVNLAWNLKRMHSLMCLQQREAALQG